MNIVSSDGDIGVFTSDAYSGGTINILFRKVGIVGSVTDTEPKYTAYPASFVSQISTGGAGKNTTNFENCYARVDLYHIGAYGFLGAGFANVNSRNAFATSKNCYWSGTWNKGSSYTGAFLRGNNFTVQNCYYDKQKFTIAQTNNGTGLTTEQMKKQESYAGWDFENTWYMGADGYPELKFEK